MERRLAAILSIDVAGYARLMGRDEAGTLAALKAHRAELIDPQAALHGGKTVKLMGDGALMEFASAVDAVRFAVAVQSAMRGRNAGEPEDQCIAFRIGINIGDVIAEGDDIHGDGVNVAARLEGLAEPGGICIRRNVRNQVRDKVALDFEDLGDVEVKNIERPVRAFHVVMNEKAEALAAAPTERSARPPSRFWQAVAGIALSLVMIAGLAWWQPWGPEFEPVDPATMARPLPAKPSIAVLAFNDLSAGEDQGYLSDAIGEGIITELSRFSEIFVIARNSSFKYRGKATDVRDIAAELGVHYVLEGSQQKSGDRLRVTIQLIDALAGNHILAESYDRDLADLFAVQDEIVRAVASRVGAEIAFRAPPTGGLARLSALELNLKSRELVRQWKRESLEQALALNLKAIEADPTSPYGYLGLAFIYVQAHYYGWLDLSPDEALARAREAAEKALELDPDDYGTHYARAYVHVQFGEQDQAIARFRKSIELNPSATNVMASMAEPLIYTGRAKEAIELLQRAMRLDPHHPDWFYWNLGWAQWIVGDCDTALTTMLSMAKIPSTANKILAQIYVCLGRQQDAEDAIAKLLEKEPDYSIAKVRRGAQDKYKNPADLERSIDALRKAGLPEEPPLALPDKPSIAVLAFDDLSAGPDKDYLSDAIAEGIITNLSYFSELFVIARNSSFFFKGKPTDVREISRDLGVRYVLEGSQQKAGDRLRVTVQLIDADSGNHIWAETYDRDLVDIFAVQDEIANSVASTVGAKVVVAAGEAAQKGNPAQFRAFEYWLKGTRHWYEWTEEGNEKARLLYLKAIDADPTMPRGHLGLAWVHINGYRFGWTELGRDEALARARERSQIALDLAPDDYFPHHTMAVVLTQAGEREQAIVEFEKALELNPNAANVIMDLAEALVYAGRMEEAIDWMHQAMRLDPHHADWFYWNLGWAQYFAGDCAEALATMRKISSLPGLAHRTVAAAHVCLGQVGGAQAAIAALLEHDPDYSVAKLQLNFKGKYKNPDDLERFIDDLRKAGLPEESPLTLPDKPSIAVLAFDDLSVGADKDYLSDAIAEGVITELSRFPELFVIARNSSFYYRDKAVALREIARELGVRYVLEGSNQKAGDRLRVKVQLIDAVAGNHVWAETYDRDLADFFRVQDEIAGAVASTVGGRLMVVASKEAARADPAQLRAFGHWLKGMKYWREWTREGNLRALEAFREAVRADPEMSRGHIGLAWAYTNGFRHGWTELGRDEALARARATAQRGLDLAPEDYYSHMSMAYVLMQAGEHENAIIRFREALALNPNSTNVMATLAEQLGYVGQGAEATELLEQAMRRDPHHPDWVKWTLGWIQYNMGECDNGLATMQKMSSLPSIANRTVAATYVCLGRLDDARAAIADLLASEPGYSITDVRAGMGDKMKVPGELERWVDHLREAGLPE